MMERPMCAVCQRQFMPGEKFALRGQYVVHRRADCLVGVPAIERDIELTNRQSSVVSQELAAERISHNRTRQRASEEAAQQQTTISDLTTRLLAERHEKQTWEADARSLRRSLDGAMQELHALQLREAMSRPPASVQGEPTASDKEPISNEDYDGMSTRFSLLELD